MELGGRKSDEGNSLRNSAEEEESRDDMEKASGSRITYYECSFCKRGFTNAQALGGHMNIHRKDKSKVKPRLPKSKAKASPPQGYMNTSFPPQIPSSYINSYMCYYSPPLPSSLHTSNPTTQPGLHGGGDPGFDLNLQIGSSSRTHEEIKDSDQGDSVDLELRLGRPPPT